MQGVPASEGRRSSRIAAKRGGEASLLTPRTDRSIPGSTPGKVSVQACRKRAASASVGVSAAQDVGSNSLLESPGVLPSERRRSSRIAAKLGGEGPSLTPRMVKSVQRSRKRTATVSVGVSADQDVGSMGLAGSRRNVGRLASGQQEDMDIWHDVQGTEGIRACLSVRSVRRVFAHGVNNCYLSCSLQCLLHSSLGEALHYNFRCRCEMDSCPSCVLRSTAHGFFFGSGVLPLDNWESVLSVLFDKEGTTHECIEFVHRLFSLFVSFGIRTCPGIMGVMEGV